MTGTNTSLVRRIDTSFFLRVVAMTTMLIDHCGEVFFSNNIWMRSIGRIAFPLFCFLLVEGFEYAASWRKHALFLLILAVISEFPYDLMQFRLNFIMYLVSQNVIWTLLFGYLVIVCLRVPEKMSVKLLLGIPVFGAACALTYLLSTDYIIFGICLIVLFYLLRQVRKKAPALRYGIIFSVVYLAAVFVWFRICYGFGPDTWQAALGYVAVLPLCLCYGGEQGYHAKWFSCLSKAFYPAHMLIIGGIVCLLPS